MTIDDWIARYGHLSAETDRLRAEAEKLREDAARNRWCEEMRADVKFSLISMRWHVFWVVGGDYNANNNPDRNAAIDAAMRGGK